MRGESARCQHVIFCKGNIDQVYTVGMVLALCSSLTITCGRQVPSRLPITQRYLYHRRVGYFALRCFLFRRFLPFIEILAAGFVQGPLMSARLISVIYNSGLDSSRVEMGSFAEVTLI